MDWDFLIRFLYLVLGACLVLSFGWLAWNSRLLYYKIWCWYQYDLRKRSR